ncbi:MAG: CdaR family protein [Lachnobacterium sp.]|nr:CdaR family protein [Lachnobacterium sp.]
MANKILKTLVNNIGYKILAVVFAFILWLVVYNIDDPNKTVRFTTNVMVENESAITDMNKCYEVLNGTNTITFSVTAKRSVINKLEDTDFIATADMNRMIMNSDNKSAKVPIEVISRRSNSSLKYNGKNQYLEISLDDLVSRRFMINADTTGQVADGYALGEVTVTNPNVLNVTGPATIVDKIDSVVATIDVEGMSMNLSDNVLPVFYDADGNEIDTTRLKYNNTTVTIAAKILRVKEIPLSFTTTGTPSGDYRVVEITSDPENIRIKGASSVLNPIMSLAIPAEVLNVSGARDDLTTTIDITEYLPDGVELVDAADATVTVTVRIEAYQSKTFTIDTKDITVNGLGDGYELAFEQNSVTVTISGLQNDLNRLSAADLASAIDVSGMEEGLHQVNLEIELDETNYAARTVSVEVKISKKSSENGDSNDDNPTDDTSDSEDTSAGNDNN